MQRFYYTWKKSLAIIILVAMLCAIALSAGFAVAFDRGVRSVEQIEYPSIQAKNTILMIGDGMGSNHIKAGGAKKGSPLFMNSLPVRGTVNTYSVLGTTTDSAAAATAMSAGTKVTNGSIAYSFGQDIENMTEYATRHGKAVGIIATETLTGATPAGFSSHAANRSQTDTIFSRQLESGAQVMIGAGKDYFDERATAIESAGYDYINSFSALSAAEGDVWASFDAISTSEGADDSPTLAQLAIYALDSLANSPEGFFLMIEGSHIDKKSHSNEMALMLAELLAFDEAVEAVYQWVAARDDTMLIVTADHETGGLQYDGQSADALSNDLFTSGGHTNTPVCYFMYAPTVFTLPERIDNTDIAKILRHVIAVSGVSGVAA